MSKHLALASGMLVFWSPVIGALVGGRVANALVLLAPIALLATIVWIRAVVVFFPLGSYGHASRGVKVTAFINAAMMLGWAALSVGSLARTLRLCS